MVRVHGGRRAPSARAGAARHKQAQQGDQKKKSSHKVILEEISEQRKLKTFLSFNAEAPPGFTFIPAGDPQLTNRCKQLARDDGSIVYIVSMSDPKHPELSHEVHRVGYHFSSTVVENACLSLGVTLTESGRVLQSSFATLNEEFPTRHGKKVKSKGKGKSRASPPKFDLSQSQATIDTQAREAIRDLFPKIPEADLHETVSRSFQKGQHLVGTSSDLSLARRAHLAVLAHIRHTHTQYDHLLKLMPWADARKRVEGPTLDVLISWRDDVDDDTNIMRDVLREIIIISDSEDEAEDEVRYEHGRPSKDNQRDRRELSVEIISVNDNMRTQQLDLAMETPEADDERPIQYIPRQIAPSSHRPVDRLREERRGAQRHRRWEQALTRKRNGHLPSPSLTHVGQPTSKSINENMQDESMLRLRKSQMPFPFPQISEHDNQRVLHSNASQNYLPLQGVDNLSSHAIGAGRNNTAWSKNPSYQVEYKPPHHRVIAASHSEYYGSGRRTPHRVLDRSPMTRAFEQAPLFVPTNNSGFVDRPFRQENETVEIITASKSPHQRPNQFPHQRRLSQRILPSVEMNDSDSRDPMPTRNEARFQHEDIPLREDKVRGRVQYTSRSMVESRDQIGHTNKRRTRDEEDVFIVNDRPRVSDIYEGHGRHAIVDPGEHAVGRPTHQRGIISVYDDGPHVVEHDPRMVQLPSRPPGGLVPSHRQAQSDFRYRQDEASRPLDLGRVPSMDLPYNSRPVIPAKAVQHIPWPEPRPCVDMLVHSREREYAPAAQPPVARIIRLDNAEEGNHFQRSIGSSRDQIFDNQGRALRTEALPRREAITYVTPTWKRNNYP